MKLPLSTTVSTVPPYRRLTAVKAITATVLPSARPLTATTAGTGTTTAVLTAASPIGVTVLPSARPVMPTTAGTKRRFRCRPTLTARPTIPTAHPNVPLGAVTRGITNPEAHALKMTPVTTERQLFQAVRATQAVLITPIVRPKSAAGLANQVIQSQVTAALKTIRLVLRITVQKEPGFLDAPAMIPAQAAEGVIISVISAGETEPAPLAAAAARTEAQWALTPVDKLSNFQKTRDNHKQSPSFEGLVFIIRVRL